MASSKRDKPRRRYELRERARRRERTRLRITEAAVELHGTVGPASTTLTEVARRAGVGRMTVYNHFPTDADLFDACSGHWFAAHPPPDASAWRAVEDPVARVATALREMFAYYRRNEGMLGNVLRDAPSLPALGEILDRKWRPALEGMTAVITDGWSGEGSSRARRVAVVRLALDFFTWRSLTGSGLSDEEAAETAAALVAAIRDD